MSATQPIIYDRFFAYDPPLEAIKLIHRGDSFILVDKPAGLLSVAGKAEGHKDCLEARLKRVDPDCRIVHRLDMATSGVMVLALNPAAHRHLGLQFERRKTAKRYEALLWGHMDEPLGEGGEIDLPLRCDWPNRPVQMVDPELGKPAKTLWQVIGREYWDGHAVTRISLTPITGRSHQLRVHMLALGYPILGDQLYAPDAAFHAATRLMLHAAKLEFHRPEDGKRVSFSSPVPF